MYYGMFRAAPHCTIHTILYYTLLYYTIVYYTITHYNMIYYTTIYYDILYYTSRRQQPYTVLLASATLPVQQLRAIADKVRRNKCTIR